MSETLAKIFLNCEKNMLTLSGLDRTSERSPLDRETCPMIELMDLRVIVSGAQNWSECNSNRVSETHMRERANFKTGARSVRNVELTRVTVTQQLVGCRPTMLRSKVSNIFENHFLYF